MQDEDFEWDDAKAASNLEKHKVSFDAARHVFADVFASSRLTNDMFTESRAIRSSAWWKTDF